MAVFNTIQAIEEFKNSLREMYKKNEATPDKWYVFTDAGGNSAWSFGQVQLDVGGNPTARGILKSFKKVDGETPEFSDTDINKLSKKETMASGDVQRYNEILSRHKAEIDSYFEQHLNNDVQLIENIVAELITAGKTGVADYITSNPYVQMGLADYNNHFPGGIEGVDRGGVVYEDKQMMKFMKGEKAVLGYGKEVQIRGNFGLEDYLNFYLNIQVKGSDRNIQRGDK